MKAEQRKELHTNALAERMTRLIESFKASPKSTSVVLWVLGILAVGTGLAWYYAGGKGSDSGALWVKLYEDTRVADLQKIYEENPGTIPARTARFQQAREYLQRGLEAMGGPGRNNGIEHVVQARRYYQQLLLECTDEPLLRQEALLALAKAEEALVGIPKEQLPGDNAPGDLKEAIKYYEQFLKMIGDVQPEKYQSLRDYVAKLTADRDAVARFYDRFNQESAKKK